MKVILNHTTPFSIAHGGVTNIVHRTHDVLARQGLEVEYLRWWDPEQKGDVLFHFGRPTIALVKFAKAAGYTVVAEHVMTGLVSRPAWKRALQKRIIAAIRKTMPQFVSDTFGWDVFGLLDMNFFPSAWDAGVAEHMFGVRKEQSTILPYGVNDAFLDSKEVPRGDFLVCTATITPRKRVLEVCRACIQAGVPIKIVGKGYAEKDEYFSEFNRLRETSPLVEHVPHTSNQAELASLYRRARGFVLLSAMETISQSAIEAAACRTPLLLSDMDWARRSFGESASYCPVTGSVSRTAAIMREFYDRADRLQPQWLPPTWAAARAHLAETLEKASAKKGVFTLAGRHM